MNSQTRNPLARAATWSIIAAGATTYAHFFGFSIMKGKLSAAGFGGLEVELNVQESVYQAAEGLTYLINTAFNDNIFGELLVQAGWFSVAFFLVALVVMATTVGNNKASPTRRWKARWRLARRDARVRGAALTAFPVALAGFGFLLPYLILIVLVTALAVLWVAMMFGHLLGQTAIVNDLKEGICIPLEEAEQRSSLVRGCARTVLADGTRIAGRVIYADKRFIYFLANDRAYKIPADSEIRVSFFDRTTADKDQPTTEDGR